MDKRTNIAMYIITNIVIGLNIYYLFGDDLLLNSKDEEKNRSTNKSTNNVFFKKEFTIISINL